MYKHINYTLLRLSITGRQCVRTQCKQTFVMFARGTMLLLCGTYRIFKVMEDYKSTRLLSCHWRILAERPSAGQAPALLGSAAVDS